MLSKALLFSATASAAKFFAVKEPIEGSYIVVLKQGVDEVRLSKHMEEVRAQNLTVKFEYNISNEFVGYSTTGQGKAGLDFLLNHDDVDFVEEDGIMRAIQSPPCSGTTQDISQSGLWGLARTSSATRPSSYNRYTYTNTGSGVTVYVIDTGIRTTHNDFGGRATFGYDATGEGSGDGNGHGTHCAGTVGGTTYGIAKRANLVAVKVLGASGSGSNSGVISGVNFVANAGGSDKKVGSMSLGGGFSSASNNAVDAAARAGVSMVVASGNSNADACNFSPASAPLAISVNAIAQGDSRSSFSNYGSCTTLFAPGSSILSAWYTSDTATSTLSGTSMACPHVAGQVAKMFEADRSLSPAAVKEAIVRYAADGAVSNPGSSSPNKLLNGC